jgi:hypothetical protein
MNAENRSRRVGARLYRVVLCAWHAGRCRKCNKEELLSGWRRHRRSHAKVRAIERYSVHINNQDLKNIAGMIRNRKQISRVRISNTKSINEIEYMGLVMLVVYSHRHDEIITFLPRKEKQTCD